MLRHDGKWFSPHALDSHADGGNYVCRTKQDAVKQHEHHTMLLRDADNKGDKQAEIDRLNRHATLLDSFPSLHTLFPAAQIVRKLQDTVNMVKGVHALSGMKIIFRPVGAGGRGPYRAVLSNVFLRMVLK